jgi:hypothetical protein
LQDIHLRVESFSALVTMFKPSCISSSALV